MSTKETKVYPIAEIFTSPQGEGLYTGVLMTFIRLAGCSVGKPFPKERHERLPHCEFKCGGDPDAGHAPDCAYANEPTPLPIYTEQCTTYDGRHFECDTDYRVKERLTVEEILARVPEKVGYICLTGGEPFIHNLVPLVAAAQSAGFDVHIETSGTVPIAKAFPKISLSSVAHRTFYDCWLTVSPKLGVLNALLDAADEVKLLVDENFDVSKVPQLIVNDQCNLVYIQPINYEHDVNKENMVRCLNLQKLFPHWRLSTQAHKIWDVR